MTAHIDLQSHALIALSRESLAALRASLFRDQGGQAAATLQEAGYAGAGKVYEAFERWVADHDGPAPDQLALPDFATTVGAFFAAAGWGTLTFSTDENGVARVTSVDWAESVAGDGSETSGCFFTTGVLADFFGRVADAPLGVMETECRSMGHPQCTFVVGTPEALQRIYDEMSGG